MKPHETTRKLLLRLTPEVLLANLGNSCKLTGMRVVNWRQAYKIANSNDNINRITNVMNRYRSLLINAMGYKWYNGNAYEAYHESLCKLVPGCISIILDKMDLERGCYDYFYGYISGDMYSILLENELMQIDLSLSFRTFRRLLPYYESGHFPCGYLDREMYFY